MKRRTQAEWAELLSEYEASGQTQAAWCSERGISPSTFWTHHQARKKPMGSSGTEGEPPIERASEGSIKWAAVTKENRMTAAKAKSVKIRMGGYTIIVPSGFDGETLSEVCKVLIRL